MEIYSSDIAPDLSNCHQNYRYDPVAWLYCKDYPVSSDKVNDFLIEMWNVVGHPYMQDSDVESCIEDIHPFTFYRKLANAISFSMSFALLMAWLM